MRMTLEQSHGISWARVRMPLTVPLVDDGTGNHQNLQRDFWNVESHAFKHKVGTAFRVWRRRGRTVYWTWRKPKGVWSADARRAMSELRLVGFFDVGGTP